MKTLRPDTSPIRGVNRGTFLRTSGTAGVALAAGGVEQILASPPRASAQGTKLHLLQWVDFIPEGDVELRRQIAEYNRQMRTEVTLETINANDLQARPSPPPSSRGPARTSRLGE